MNTAKHALHEAVGLHSTATRWALITAGAFVLTVCAHEFAHVAVGLAARPFTSDWRPVGTLAGPVASLLILMGSILLLERRERLPQPRRWVFAVGLTAAARVLFVWLLAAPWLLGWRPSVTFDELSVSRWIGGPVEALLAIETVLALGGAAWLVRAIPAEERRAGLLGIIAGVAVVGFAVMLVDPRV